MIYIKMELLPFFVVSLELETSGWMHGNVQLWDVHSAHRQARKCTLHYMTLQHLLNDQRVFSCCSHVQSGFRTSKANDHFQRFSGTDSAADQCCLLAISINSALLVFKLCLLWPILMFRNASRLALAGASVAGASVAAVFATTQDVEGCKVPERSLLDYASQTQEVWYQDCFRTRVSIEALGSVGRVRTTDAFMQAFFRYN